MIESFLQISRELLKDEVEVEDFVKYLTIDLEEKKKGKKQHVLILKINTEDDRKFKLDIDFEEISDETANDIAKKYLWVGNPPAANSPQDRFTTNNLEYLVSQTIPNLIKLLPDCDLKRKLQNLKEKLYFDLGPKEEIGSSEGQYERYRYIWDLSKFGINLSPEEIKEQIKKETSKGKKAVKIVTDKVMEFIKQKTSLRKEEIALFTISLNEEILCDNKEYRKYIYDTLINEIFEEAENGKCHLCSEEKKVTWDTTKFWFKFYMTDKVGFSSNLQGEKAFLKNYSLCEECYKSILLAEVFIKNNLSSYLSNYSVYILPSLYLQHTLPIKKMEDWAKYFKNKFWAVATIEGWYSFQQKFEEYKEYQLYQDGFLLNFLFGEKSQAAFKVYQLIQDVPPSRLDKIIETAAYVQELGENFIDENIFYLSLGKIYYLFPIGKTKNKKTKFILNFYNSLFSSVPIDYQILIKEFVKRIWEVRFSVGEEEYNDIDFSNTILLQNFLLCYLRKLSLLKGGEIMYDKIGLLDDLEISDDVKKFFKEARYSEEMASLFLLGKLIGEIGKEQYNKGDKKKSILNKINFQGMDVNKLIRLYNDVYEKMKQYKVLSAETEKIYGISKELFDKNKINWKLTPQENVFYILSGYSFTTYKAIISRKQKITEEKEVENE
jgi:CRISPR-associated protein Csh1